MKESKIIKSVVIIISVIMISIIGMPVISYASDDLSTIPKGQVYAPNSTINGITSKILGAVTVICYTAAVIIVLLKGVQIMLAAPDQKAKISEQMIGVAVGAIILFAIGTIVKIVADLSQQVV